MRNRDELSKLAATLGGLAVLGIQPGSPAANMGIRYGDIVLSVNGMPTPDWGAYVQARARQRGEMVVEIFRDGARHTRTLVLEHTEPADPLAVLADLIEQRVLAARPSGDRDPEPS